MGYRRYVFNARDAQTSGLQRPDRRFSAGSRALDHHINGAQSVVHCLAGGGLTGALRCECGSLT